MKHSSRILLFILAILMVCISSVAAQTPTATLQWSFDKTIGSVAWSPDENQLAFWSDNKLNVVNIVTGEIHAIFTSAYETNNYSKTLVWSPNQETIALGMDGEDFGIAYARLINVKTGEMLWEIVTHSLPSFMFSPDGNRVAILDWRGSGDWGQSVDSFVQIMDTLTGQVLHSLQLSYIEVGITSIVWKPNGDGLLIAIDGNIKDWDFSELTKNLIGSTEYRSVYSMLLNQAGDRLITENEAIHVWNLESGLLINSYGNNHHGEISWGADENQLFVIGTDFEIINPANGKLLGLRKPAVPAEDAYYYWSPKGKYAARVTDQSLSVEESVLLPPPVPRAFDISIQDIPNNPPALSGDIQWSPNGDVLLVSSTTIANLSHLEQPAKAISITNDKVGMSLFTSDGQRVAFGVSDNETRTYDLQLWDVEAHKKLQDFVGHSSIITALAFSPDNKYLASGSADDTIRVWDTQTGQQQVILLGHTGRINDLHFSPDGKTLLSAGDEKARLWDVATGKSLALLTAYTEYVGAHSMGDAVFSPDGSKIIYRDQPENQMMYGLETIRVWDIATQQYIEMGPLNYAFDVLYSPDMKSYVPMTMNPYDSLVNAQTNAPIAMPDIALVGFREKASFSAFSADLHGTWVTFSEDGRLVAISINGDMLESYDNETPVIKQNIIEIIDTKTMSIVSILGDNASAPYRLAFSPNGKQLLSQSLDGTVHLWDVQMGVIVNNWTVIIPNKYIPAEPA